MIKLAIAGYGNLGRGVESAVRQNEDMELVAVFTRRDPASVKLADPAIPVLPISTIESYADKVDVLILCGGSATDLPVMTPKLAEKFNVVDSFDNHAKIPEHIANVHKAATANHKTAAVSCGWDPGMFSLARVYAEAALPVGETYTFWGPGISQGHSDAIRRIEGVEDARQYTIPVAEALDRVRSGENPQLTTRQKHLRQCWVVAKEGADLAGIEKQIKEMPGYFADYDTTVNFISREALDLTGTPYKELIQPCYLGPLVEEDVQEAAVGRATVDLEMAIRGGCRVKLHAGPGHVKLGNQQDKEVKFIFDQDLYMPGQLPVNLSAGAPQTLHCQADSIFRGAITDTLHDAMMPESL